MSIGKTAPGPGVGQTLHIICLVILLFLVAFAWKKAGQPEPVAFWTAIAIPILHQIFVWLSWRLELKNSAISKSIGFRGYMILFFILFAGRFISVAILGWLDRGSLGLPMIPRLIFTILPTLIGIYTMYSVARYFGFARASGADHFDPRYRDMPLVKEGIFRFTNNGMYVYAFLIFWAIAIGFNSIAALIVVAFSHAYIWVHFYCTEKPDMDILYSSGDEQKS